MLDDANTEIESDIQFSFSLLLNMFAQLVLAIFSLGHLTLCLKNIQIITFMLRANQIQANQKLCAPQLDHCHSRQVVKLKSELF